MLQVGFVAAGSPVWLLLAPRDYPSTFLKIGTIVGLAVGTYHASDADHAGADQIC